MKLRNKKTGEIGTPRVEYQELYVDTENGYTYCYKSLQKMCQEWEDYEEPKESEYYWYIGYKNDIRRTKYHHISDFADNQATVTRKEIGNCFESLEEAELAVRKLKAWKRLKDKGFRFTGLSNESIGYEIKELSGDFALDLDLLFNGGEE